MSRVMLTGATGFVGRHALTALAQAGHEVIIGSRDAAKAVKAAGLTGDEEVGFNIIVRSCASPLDQIADHVEPLCGGDVAGLLKIAHNQAGQQSQAERMVAVRFAGRLNLGVRAADALGAEEFHGVGRLHLPELLLATALQQSAALGFQHVRTKPGG